MRVYKISGYQSEYQRLEASYAREERRRILAAFLGILTAAICAVGILWVVS